MHRVVRDSAIYGMAAVISRGLNLLLVPFYTRVMAPSDFGLLDMATAVITFASLTVALEIGQALARFLPEAQRHEERVAVASTALLFTVGAYALVATVAFLAADPLERLIFGTAAPPGFMALVIGGASISGIFSLVLNQLRSQLLPTAYATASLAYASVSIGVTVLLVLGLGTGVMGVLAGQAVGAGVGLAVGWQRASGLYRLTIDRALLHAMLRFSGPLVVSSISVFVTLYIDRIAIRSLMTFADVGLFGVGFRIASIVSLALVGFQFSFAPLVYSRYREQGTPAVLARIFRSFVALAILLVLVLSVFATEILRVATTPEYAGGAVVVPLLAPALLFAGAYVFAPGLAIAKRTGVTSVLHIGGAVANTALNFSLIPWFGIGGAALATLVSNAAVFAGYMITSQRTYPVPHAWGRIGLGAAVGVAAFALSTQLPAASLPAIGGRILLVTVAAGAMVAIGLVRSDELGRVLALARGRMAGDRA